MKIYFAGAESGSARELIKKSGGKRILVSYFNYRSKHDKFQSILDDSKYMDIFCDCGAYSAWTLGKTIDVHDYAKFLMKYHMNVDIYPNLDVKGDLKQTLLNQRILEDYGLKPISVFHLMGGDFKVLEKYIEEYKYIAIGAIAGETMSDASLKDSLNKVFIRIGRNPVTKLHGFGFTRIPFLKLYPFYSVDSTTWMQSARFGIAVRGNKFSEMHTKARSKTAPGYLIKETIKMENYLTKYWAMRGLNFD